MAAELRLKVRTLEGEAEPREGEKRCVGLKAKERSPSHDGERRGEEGQQRGWGDGCSQGRVATHRLEEETERPRRRL
jgi:hypothetical protein